MTTSAKVKLLFGVAVGGVAYAIHDSTIGLARRVLLIGASAAVLAWLQHSILDDMEDRRR